MSESLKITDKSTGEHPVSVTRRGEAVGTIAALALTGVAGYGALKYFEHANDAQEVAAVKSISGAQNDILILNEGAHVRAYPEMQNDGTSGDNNIAFTVPSGKKVMIKFPMTSQEHPGYAAFEDPRETENGKPSIVWVNEQSLLDQHAAWLIPQGKAGENLQVQMREGQFVAQSDPQLTLGDSVMGEGPMFENELRYAGVSADYGQ